MVDLIINLDVPDLDAAVAFYTSAFELHVGRKLGAFAVELLGGKVPINLLSKAAASSAFGEQGQPRSYARHWTPLHLDYVVPKLEPALRRAEAAGAKVEQGISEHSWGRMALLSDPFGHGFCLIEFSDRGYDTIAEEQG